MNYNKLLFFIIVLGFSSMSMSLKAQNVDVKEKNQIDFTEIIDKTPVLLETLMPNELKPLKMANRHLDLIKATVRAKIKCTSDLFIIVNNKEAC
ncbi:hypothetical protein ACFFVB_07935 [Formosa undariae]|uniref:Uncharacterized protein n=1 Tax=Formosa undariae TaxID=1325436 RepID=A0ABV5F0P1_9FLAO